MPAQLLTGCDREEIRVGTERDETDEWIGGWLDRHRITIKTINSEIHRTGGGAVCSATKAQARADAQRSRPNMRERLARGSRGVPGVGVDARRAGVDVA